MVVSNDTRREFRYAAGEPWLNLLGTVADRLGPDPVERLWDTSRLAEWLHHELGSDPELPVSEADLDHARRIREVLRSLALSAVTHSEPDPQAVAAANRSLAQYSPPTAYIAGGQLRFTAPDSVPQAMAWLVRQGITTLTTDTVAKLRTCAEPDCGAIFLDPIGRRRWCPSGRCGVKTRVRAHRQRTANSPRRDTIENTFDSR